MTARRPKSSGLEVSLATKRGKIVVDEAKPGDSMVHIEVETASVDTANEKRDDHLRNQDFFKVKEFPTMTFKSSSVEKNSDGDYEVTGSFTLLGEQIIRKAGILSKDRAAVAIAAQWFCRKETRAGNGSDSTAFSTFSFRAEALGGILDQV